MVEKKGQPMKRLVPYYLKEKSKGRGDFWHDFR